LKPKKILIPLPSYGFDPTEVAIPWRVLSEAGFDTIFATPDGNRASADSLMLNGDRLGILKPILRARMDAVAAYRELEATDAFNKPASYCAVHETNFDALLLPGGHDKGVKEYLESTVLQQLVAQFFSAKKPVAAICHGVVLAARSINPTTGKSVLHDYKTTALLNKQELLAYKLTKLWLKDYYLTYPEITVEDEVTAALSNKEHFLVGPKPVLRDDRDHLARGFTVRDRNYLSARWPGDAYRFSLEFAQMVGTWS
jgi:putative intracellular protease/amidase